MINIVLTKSCSSLQTSKSPTSTLLGSDGRGKGRSSNQEFSLHSSGSDYFTAQRQLALSFTIPTPPIHLSSASVCTTQTSAFRVLSVEYCIFEPRNDHRCSFRFSLTPSFVLPGSKTHSSSRPHSSQSSPLSPSSLLTQTIHTPCSPELSLPGRQPLVGAETSQYASTAGTENLSLRQGFIQPWLSRFARNPKAVASIGS